METRMMQKHRDSNWLVQPKRHTMRRVLPLKITEAVRKSMGCNMFKKKKKNPSKNKTANWTNTNTHTHSSCYNNVQ